jgi:peptide deformylase
MLNEILTIDVAKEEKFLRRKTVDFDFKKFTKKETSDLIHRMRRIMRNANGIGLSANQIGLDVRVFIAEVPDAAKGGTKFYAVFNPKIEKVGEEKATYEEGCLSIPGKWGDVQRAKTITISGQDKNGKPAKIKAWGLLAHVFQHETDHLNGKLFIDRTKQIHENHNPADSDADSDAGGGDHSNT